MTTPASWPSSNDSPATLGFEVVFRNNGEDALACLASVKPDAALVDLQMPGIGGIDVLRALRARRPGLPGDPDDGQRDARYGDRGRQSRRARLPDQAVRLRTPAWLARDGTRGNPPARAAPRGRCRRRQAVRISRHGRAKPRDAGAVRFHQTAGAARPHGPDNRRDRDRARSWWPRRFTSSVRATPAG